MVKIAVLGAGVIGLACALKIQEKFKDFQVTLISDEFTPNTTGDGSGGLWYPYLCGDTPGDLLTKWAQESYRFLHDLWLKGEHGVCAVPIYLFNRGGHVTPAWARTVFGYRNFDLTQLDYFNQLYSGNYVAGHTFLTFIIPPQNLMSHLKQRFKFANGKSVRAKLSSLQDCRLEEIDIVVNCTGIGARDLVPDNQVYAIRGQVAKVHAPWINECIIDLDGGNYIIPNSEACVLGGTHQDDDYNTKVNDNDTKFILDGCKTMIPGLVNCNLLSVWAGLRPGRSQVRLESENKHDKLYVHNYGHGGSGLTVFWGCAADVVNIIETHLNKNIKCKL